MAKSNVDAWPIRAEEFDITKAKVNRDGSYQDLDDVLDDIAAGVDGGDFNTFSTIAVSGQSNVVADSTADTLTLAAGSNITITTNASTDTVTITAAGNMVAANNLSDILDPATARTNLGLEIGGDVQGYDAFLDDIAGLADPGADRLLFWDDSAGEIKWLTAGTGLSITGTEISATGGGGVSDGDKGDITVSSSGATWTIDSNVISTFGRTLTDDADAAAARTTLELGTLATQSGTFSGTSSGTNTGDQNLFATIAVSGQSNVVADSATDTLTLVAGSGITLTTDAGADSVTIAASGGSQNVFSTIAVSGQSDVVADSTTDTLTLVAGANVSITTNATTDTITIAASGSGSGMTLGLAVALATFGAMN